MNLMKLKTVKFLHIIYVNKMEFLKILRNT